MRLLVRDNLLDHVLLRPSPGGVRHPFSRNEQVWHYQSPDVKLDAAQVLLTGAGVVIFQQNEPEAVTPPLTPSAFEQLKDHSLHLPAARQAQVHVQVHNRGAGIATGVQVWAITCNAARGATPASRPVLGAVPTRRHHRSGLA